MIGAPKGWTSADLFSIMGNSFKTLTAWKSMKNSEIAKNKHWAPWTALKRVNNDFGRLFQIKKGISKFLESFTTSHEIKDLPTVSKCASERIQSKRAAEVFVLVTWMYRPVGNLSRADRLRRQLRRRYTNQHSSSTAYEDCNHHTVEQRDGKLYSHFWTDEPSNKVQQLQKKKNKKKSSCISSNT